MAFITLEEAKAYLRVDSSDDDSLIQSLLDSAGILCADIARLTDEEWAAVDAENEDLENGITPSAKLSARRKLMRIAILYERRFREAEMHSILPDNPDMASIEVFVESVNYRVVTGDIG